MANNSKKRQGTPRSYWGYLALLVGSLALFSCYAFFTKDTLVSFDLKKMNLAKYMLPDSIPQDSLALIDTLALDTPEEDSPCRRPILPEKCISC